MPLWYGILFLILSQHLNLNPLKKILHVIYLVALSHVLTFAQILPLDEAGKVTYTEVVKLDSSYSSTLLFNNAMRWTKLLRNDNKKPVEVNEDIANGIVSGSHNFYVYQETFKVGVLQKVNGLISYDFKIESRQGRYKYTFTNFIFHYYSIDRLNSYEYLTPKPNGKTKKLEDPKAPGWGDTWRAHKASVRERMQQYTENLKKFMAEDPEKEKLYIQKKDVEQKKLKDNW